MDAGQLNRRVTLERATDLADGTRLWTAMREVWCAATPTGGKEALVNGTLRNAQGWRVELRFQEVRLTDRLRADWLTGPKFLNVLSAVDPDGRRARLVLLCETDSGAG